MPIALTRDVSPCINRCELTHLARERIDVARARAQHARYEQCLASLGCRVVRLPEAPDLPDSVFVEDCAVVLDEVALITRPGAESRRGEIAPVAAALGQWRPLVHIQAPATVDGGDVLVVGRTVFVGQSSRTNASAMEQMRQLLLAFDYEVKSVDVRGCLHLKSAATAIGPGTVLVNPAWIHASAFDQVESVPVHPSEPWAANVLRIADDLVCSSSFPRTAESLEKRGLRVHSVDSSELAKAEGALTCCSLIIDGDS